MKLLPFITIISSAVSTGTSFSCPRGDIGACCEAYDPGEKLGYECSLLSLVLVIHSTVDHQGLIMNSTGQEAARAIVGGTSTWSCEDPIDIFSECCSDDSSVSLWTWMISCFNRRCVGMEVRNRLMMNRCRVLLRGRAALRHSRFE